MSQLVQQPIHPQNNDTVFKATELAISTCTIITNINGEIDLSYFSRFVSVYDQLHPMLEHKTGGIYNIEYYGNITRGDSPIDKIKDEFSNQATVKFKYWGFRHINIKLFMNGRLQMTGLKSRDESKEISKLVIELVKNIQIPITTRKEFIGNCEQIAKEFQLVIDPSNKKVYYYRYNYDTYLNFYKNLITKQSQNSTTSTTTSTSKESESNILIPDQAQESNTTLDTQQPSLLETEDKPIQPAPYQRKYRSVVTYQPEKITVIPYTDNITSDELTTINFAKWSSDEQIIKIITKLAAIKSDFIHDFNNLLSTYKNIADIKTGIEDIISNYTDFRSPILDKIISTIQKNINSENESILEDIKEQLNDYYKDYKNSFEKKIIRLLNIRNTDVEICSTIEQYLNGNPELFNKLPDTIALQKLKPLPNYSVTDINIVLINSDYLINSNLNLKKVSKLFKKLGFFNSYEPDDYPGVLTRYYYNTNNTTPGICNCIIHCSTKEKKSICTKITISIFRPGSIIITGARDVFQLKTVYNLIYSIIKENINLIRGVENDDDQKQVALMNNEFRKISRKPRLFYIKKSAIVNYPKNSSLFD